MIYDVVLALIYLGLSFGKKRRHTDPFGRAIPVLQGGTPTLWIHAVSVGEVKAASAFIPEIQRTHPQAQIVVSTITATGLAQAKVLIPEACLHFRLPLDFKPVMEKLVKKIKPNLLVLIEGDFWYNMLKATHRYGAKIFLVSGKLSERSRKRYRFFPALFKFVERFYVQNALYQKRFESLGLSQVEVTGNLKYDIPPQIQPFSMESGNYITLGSTHEGEEQVLLQALAPLLESDPTLRILVAPRHPERFDRVRELLIAYPRATLIDQMGVLSACYQKSRLAIVGGSFLGNVGGHDVLEPVRFGVPVLFGPEMHKQEELKCLVEEGGVGKGCTLETLCDKAAFFLSHPCRDQAEALMKQLSGTARKTWEKIACSQ